MPTRLASILSQSKNLVRAAAAHTGDLNEAHLLVHQVMTHALFSPTDENLDHAMQRALQHWRAPVLH